MTDWSLGPLLIGPLTTIYDFLFGLLPDGVGVGLRILAFSVLLNLLLLPIYAGMERRAVRVRAGRDELARDVARMKRHFSGRERYFYIRAVYRQHHYRPIAELLGSTDLLLQIIVFATVYQYLAGLETLKGQSLGPIHDLSRPDRLLFGLNVLPVIMTAVNLASVFAYSSDKARRVQGVALAVIFLVLLYSKAAGLVLYWTANNCVSLTRNIIATYASSRTPIWLRQLTVQLQSQR